MGVKPSILGLGRFLMGHRHESLPHTWMNEKRAYFPKLLAADMGSEGRI
jgi:hypothetical protein